MVGAVLDCRVVRSCRGAGFRPETKGWGQQALQRWVEGQFQAFVMLR